MRIPGFRTRLTQKHVERMRIPRRFWDVTFDGVPESVRGDLARFLQQLDEMVDEGDGLLLWGPNGVGKTSVAVLIGYEVVRRGGTCLFITTEDLRQAILDGTAFDEDQSVAERVQEVDLLILDDLGKEYRGHTEYTERMLENLIRTRSAARRSTIVTTNLPLMGNRARKVEGLSTVYSKSLLEVTRETMYPVNVEGENQRKAGEARLQQRIAV